MSGGSGNPISAGCAGVLTIPIVGSIFAAFVSFPIAESYGKGAGIASLAGLVVFVWLVSKTKWAAKYNRPDVVTRETSKRNEGDE